MSIGSGRIAYDTWREACTLACDFYRYSASHLLHRSTFSDIAEPAGKLRGKYPALRAMDAIQLAVALDVGTDAFITNDRRLKSVTEIEVIILKEYI